MFKPILVVLLSTVIAAPARADPNPQLVRSVENGLAQYGLHADVSEFATPTVARLYMTLSSSEVDECTRCQLKQILRNPKYKDQRVDE